MSGPSSVQGRQRLPSGQLQHKDERADPPPTLHPPSLPAPVKVQISNGTFRWGDGKEKKSEGSAKSTSKGGAAVAGAASSGVGAMEEDEEEVKEGETEETTQENLQIDTRKNGYSALPSSSLSKGAHDATDKEEGSKNGGEESESSALARDVVDDNDSKQGEEVEEEEQGAQVNALRGVNLEVSEGSLCCVYGVTGGGKTSLLSALLGEMTTVEGCVRLDGSVAYTAQKAWNQNATIRSNILFNGCNDFANPEEQSRYDAAVAACALASDFQVLKGGDLTEIREKGITLSGGQQQRIALARACFADADVYLLDDPLSAVDAHVGEHMFHSAVCGLLKHKTRVLVTHQVALTLPKADWVVVVGSGGEILEQGTGDNLRLDPASHLNNLLRSLGKQEGEEEGEEEEEEGGDDGGVGDADEAGEVVTGGDDDDDDDDEKTPSSPPSSPSSSSPRSPTSRAKNPKHATKKFDAARLSTSEAMASAQLVKEEERQQGAPSWAVYESYVQACGGWPVVGFVVLLTFAVTGLAYVAALAMAAWIEDMESGGAADNRRGLYNYLAATAVWVFCMWAWIFVRQLASLRASNTLHGKMMESVLRAPIGWFDRTPLGRIQNRFSSDMQSLDREVMSSVMGFVLCASAPLMSLFVLFTHLPLFLAPVFLLVVLCASKVAKRYLTTARELKRLQSTAKSPLYAHFTETLHGLSTLRAFGGAEERFTRQNLVKVDEANAAELYLWCAQRWLGFRLNCLGAVVNGTCGAYIWFAGDMNPAIAGLVLNYASDFTAYVAAMITSLASMEMAMNAVERAGEFCALPQEAAAESPLDAQLEAVAWPSGGAIQAKNLSLRYESSTSNVVDGISFDIPSKASVGIVGRTGAGKSTLSLALLRVLEAWEGTLAIDGVDLSSVGLDHLRSSVAIVPQDPMLFNGSVRFNLDPFDRYEDHVLLAALERVQLTELWTNKAVALGRKSSGSNLAAMSSQLELQLEGERETGGASAVAAADDKGGGKDPNTLKASNKGVNKGLAEPLLSGADDDFNLKERLVSGVASGGVAVGAGGSFLDMSVSESGSNLSVGERQLLCLARALIRNNKVLVMDEATANVDPQTDERIQRVIRNELASATVLTVAHRLGTIIYYDLVMVMGQGKILELATPSELLADKSSAFFAMCEKTGDLEHLISEANLSEEKKKTQEGAAAVGTHQELQS